MGQNVNPFRWQSISLMSMTSLFLVITCEAQTDRYITIPALGRFAEIGYLYDERTDRIIDATVFRHKVPSDSVTEFHNPTTSTETTTENSFEHLRQRFDISLDTAVNILVGILKPKGAASILINPNKRNKATPTPTGTLLVKYETAVQRLHVFYDELKGSYNPYLLNHREATHVVTGVTWGARLAVTLKVNLSTTNSTDINTEVIKDQMNDELMKLEEEFSKAIDSNSNSNFKFSINADVTPNNPKPVTPKSLKDVQQFLLQFPEQIKSINGGKGVPLEFKLTPISLLREFLQEPTRHQNVAVKVQDSILRKLTVIFYNFQSIEQRINNLQKLLSSQPNCVTPHVTIKIHDISSFYIIAKSSLTDELKATLFRVRSGNQTASVLEDLAHSYKPRNHSFKFYQTKFAEFDGALQKIEFCKTIAQGGDIGSPIEYFGLNQNLILRIGEESVLKSVLILFTKTEWTQNDAVKFTENLNTILRGLNTSSHQSISRFIVDCDFDFDQPFCSNLTETTIHTYENGMLTSTDLMQTVRLVQEESYVQKQLKDLQNATALLFQMFEENNLKKYKCSAGNLCFNGGSCADTLDGFECTCSPGFEGLNCEKQTDNCLNDLCQNNGACRSSNYSFSCTCQPGFTGKLCDVNINECTSGKSPCENGSHCIDEVGGYTCVCPMPWAGQNCQYKMEDPCRLNPCQNGASCAASLNNADFKCNCERGFIGTLCEVDMDPCSRNSFCQNNGACKNTNGSFACDCAPGFDGIICGININDCESSSCFNGGTCVDGIKSFHCICSTKFAGDRCEEIAVSVCSASEKASRNQTKTLTLSEAGLVYMPDLPSPSSFLFEYKPVTSHVGNKKNQIWTLENVYNEEYYVFTCRVTLLCGNSRDTVSVLNGHFGNNGYVISSTELVKNSHSFVSGHNYARKLYLSYTSADGLLNGFLVLIDISEVIPGNHGSNFVYTNRLSPSGSLTHGPTKSWDKFSIVINQMRDKNNTFIVENASTKLTTCDAFDVLNVFEIPPTGTPHRLDRLCGNVTSPIFFISQFPIVATSFGDGNGGYTFRLSWK